MHRPARVLALILVALFIAPAGLAFPLVGPPNCQFTDFTPPSATITSPVAGALYIDDVVVGSSPYPETSVVSGPLTIAATAADDCQLAGVYLYRDATLVAAFTDHPISWTWPDAGRTEGVTHFTLYAQDRAARTTAVSLPVRVLAVSESAKAVGIYAGANVPTAVELIIGTSSAHGAGANQERAFGDRTFTAAGDHSYASLRTHAATERDGEVASAQANSWVSEVSLLGGFIQADTVRASSAVSFDIITSGTERTTSGSFIENLRIGGIPYALTGGQQEVPLPGYGHLRVFEVEISETAGFVIQQVNALHLFVDTPSVKAEVIVGSARAQAGFLSTPAEQNRRIYDVDDAGTDADAPSDFGSATPIRPGLISGSLGGEDAADTYKFVAGEGDRLIFDAIPAARAETRAEREPTAEPYDPGMEIVTSPPKSTPFYLFDPDFVLRERALLGVGEHMEFNADKLGVWYILLESTTAEHHNYSLTFAITPVVFLPEAEAGFGDTPAACEEARRIEPGVHAGVLRGEDYADAYRFHVDIGDYVEAVLKPDELDDGADFDLYLLGPSCEVIDMSNLGNDALLPKGTPELVGSLPAQHTGDYVLIVDRYNGVGNYYLELTVTEGIPPIPGNDGGSGRDSESAGDAIPIAANGVIQGRFPDETDNHDWYQFTAQPGRVLRLTLSASPLSESRLELYDLNMQFVGWSETWAGPAVITVSSTLPGTYYVHVARQSGGGNYLLSSTLTAQ